MLIQINHVVFAAKLGSVTKNKNEVITASVYTPELSGKIPAMTAYINGYGEVKGMIDYYKMLLTQDITNLKSLEQLIIKAEENLIR